MAGDKEEAAGPPRQPAEPHLHHPGRWRKIKLQLNETNCDSQWLSDLIFFLTDKGERIKKHKCVHVVFLAV